MAGRHDKPPSPHLFLRNSLLVRLHAPVSIIVVISSRAHVRWNRAIGCTFLSRAASQGACRGHRGWWWIVGV